MNKEIPRRRFRVALVGCGGVSRMHLDGYARHPERVQVVSACDPDGTRLAATQGRYGIGQGFRTVEEMIARADFDAAVICTPTSVREEVVRLLAADGKQILVEKPLADSLEEARRIVQTCEREGVSVAVNQNFRFHYPFHIARRLIAEGRLGKPLGLLHQDLMFRQDAGWRTERERHALSVMGVHWLDGFRWMLGQEAASLVCRTHSSPALECAGETDAFLQITFTDGAVASYIQSFSSAVGRTETTLLCEAGTLLLRYDEALLFDTDHRSEPAARWDNPFGTRNKPESAYLSLDALLTAVEQEEEPVNSGEDNLKTIALLEAAYRSAAEDRAVTFRQGIPV